MGLGAGTLATARASGPGAAPYGDLLEPHPFGAWGDAPSREVVLSSRPWDVLSERPVVNASPGLVRTPYDNEPSELEPSLQSSFQLHFRNSYGLRIWVCISFYDPVNCGALGQWGTRGWWTIDHGQSAYVLNTTHRQAYYYAEASNGAFWAGSTHAIYAPQTAFNSCLWNQRIGDRYLGMRPVNISSDVYTVNLTP
ncbi:hypothetical protein BHS07_25015 [Myxococcus xanthus]|nr:hypothetical protein BHS07_25015 [Myxococcus xanthus]QDE98713.1 hypothetical protein BHS05_24350 [Myxococcus xanthus]QDF06371.1 hypothetical protein BHS04_24680 [Myxococcus xanthus]